MFKDLFKEKGAKMGRLAAQLATKEYVPDKVREDPAKKKQPKGSHHLKKSPSVWKKFKGGGGPVRIQTFRGTFCCCLCLEIFDAGGGVLPKSKLFEELFCSSLNFF